MTAIDLRTLQFDCTLAAFGAASIDCQLAIIWHTYRTMGQAIADAAPVALFSQGVQRLINQFQQVNRGDRLDVLRDILAGEQTRFSEEYEGLNLNMKLAFWHRLTHAVAVDAVPSFSACSHRAEIQTLLRQLDSMGLNERLHFLRRVLN